MRYINSLNQKQEDEETLIKLVILLKVVAIHAFLISHAFLGEREDAVINGLLLTVVQERMILHRLPR